MFRTILVIMFSLFFQQSIFAQSEKGGKSAGKGKGREKNIVREGATKKGDRTKIDFDSTDIDGQRKIPLGTILNNTKSDKNYDFVKIRLRWHPEMVQSASNLESGRSLK